MKLIYLFFYFLFLPFQVVSGEITISSFFLYADTESNFSLVSSTSGNNGEIFLIVERRHAGVSSGNSDILALIIDIDGDVKAKFDLNNLDCESIPSGKVKVVDLGTNEDGFFLAVNVLGYYYVLPVNKESRALNCPSVLNLRAGSYIKNILYWNGSDYLYLGKDEASEVAIYFSDGRKIPLDLNKSRLNNPAPLLVRKSGGLIDVYVSNREELKAPLPADYYRFRIEPVSAEIVEVSQLNLNQAYHFLARQSLMTDKLYLKGFYDIFDVNEDVYNKNHSALSLGIFGSVDNYFLPCIIESESGEFIFVQPNGSDSFVRSKDIYYRYGSFFKKEDVDFVLNCNVMDLGNKDGKIIISTEGKVTERNGSLINQTVISGYVFRAN